MRQLIVSTTFLMLSFLAGGCQLTPQELAAESRALYTESATQIELACKDAPTDPAARAKFEEKCAEAKVHLAKLGKGVDALEVAAAAMPNEPGKSIDFIALLIEYRPKLQGFLINVALRRYLGV